MSDEPALLADGTGGFYAAWYLWSSSTGPVQVDRFTTNGADASGWPAGGVVVASVPAAPQCLGNLGPCSPGLVVDGAGGVETLWFDTAPRMARIGTDGTPLWGGAPVTLGDGVAHSGSNLPPGATLLASLDGNPISPVAPGVLAMWFEPGGAPRIPLERRLLADGSRDPGWSANPVLLQTAGSTPSPLEAFSDGLGGAWVTWQEAQHPARCTSSPTDASRPARPARRSCRSARRRWRAAGTRRWASRPACTSCTTTRRRRSAACGCARSTTSAPSRPRCRTPAWWWRAATRSTS